MVISQRPDNMASVMDIAMVRKLFRSQVTMIEERIEYYDRRCIELQDEKAVRKTLSGLSIDEVIAQADQVVAAWDRRKDAKDAQLSPKMGKTRPPIQGFVPEILSPKNVSESRWSPSSLLTP